MSIYGVFMPQSLYGSVTVDRSYCSGCHSNRSHSRNEWVVQAAGRGAAPNWQPTLGQTEQAAPLREREGGCVNEPIQHQRLASQQH